MSVPGGKDSISASSNMGKLFSPQKEADMGTFIDRNLEHWRVSPGSKLSYTATFRRLNHKLLKWEWQPGSWIEYTISDLFRLPDENFFGKAHPTFSFRVLQEYEREGMLRFEFRTNEEVSCFFEFNLQFSGWRSGWVSYWRDMIGSPEERLDSVRIYAPLGCNAGAIYFNEIQPCSFLDSRLHMRDAQLPLVNSDANNGAGHHWMGLYEFSQRQPPEEPLERPNARDRADMHTIERYLTQHLINKYKALDTSHDTPETIMVDLGLKRKTARLAGPPPTYAMALEIYPPRIRTKYQRLLYSCNIEKYFKNLFRLAGKIRYAENNESSRKIESFCLELLQFLRFHGWDEGSGQGTLRDFGYSMGQLGPALLLMRDFLAKHGELDRWRKILRWFAGTGRIYPGNERNDTSENVDILSCQLNSMLISILLDPNEASRRGDLDYFRHWLDRNLRTAPGVSDWIKPDGAIFHRCNHYPSHGITAMKRLLPMLYSLAGTGFDISPEGWNNLCQAGLTIRWYSNSQALPMSMAGSMTAEYSRIDPEIFYHLSMIGRKRGDDANATTAANTFLRLTTNDKKRYDNERNLLLRLGATAEQPPEGTCVINYAAALTHRRHNWLAVVRGHSRYLWRSEILPSANIYGRYQTFGQLEVLPEDASNFTFRHHGWDWNRWPGTTVPVKPLRALHADLRQLDEYSGFEEMLLSPEAFTGGCNLAGRYGVFAMLLRGHPKYERNFVARKSWFFYDDIIVCLGSGISSDDKGCPVQTNLFQSPLQQGAAAGINIPMMNGCNLNAARIDSCGGIGTWLSDTCSNGYYLPSGEFTVTFGRQYSRSWDDTAETEGFFSSAWLEHGVSPQNAAYEYVVLPQGAENAADFAQAMTGPNPPYQILRHDLAVHAITCPQDKLNFIVMFNAGLTGLNSVVNAVDKPALLSYRQDEDTLQLAVCNPDLNLYQGDDLDQFDENGKRREVSIFSRSWVRQASRPIPLRVELNGVWKLHHESSFCRITGHTRNSTILEFMTSDAIPREVILQHS